MTVLCIRAEVHEAETRVPLSPAAAGHIIRSGHNVLVERSPSRVFHDEDFAREGCVLVSRDHWQDLPSSAVVLGMKSLPAGIRSIAQTHVYFAHAYDNERIYREKDGTIELLRAFKEGGGRHLDFESLRGPDGFRLVYGGTDAGRTAACLAILQWAASNSDLPTIDFASLIGTPYRALEERAIRSSASSSTRPRCVVIGAAGRCGEGTSEVLTKAGIPFERWSRTETSQTDCGLRLARFDIIFNCASAPTLVEQFLTDNDLDHSAEVAMLVDVGCEQSGNNPLKFYGKKTALREPFKIHHASSRSIQVMAVDNLPSFIAKESSSNFSRQLLPYMEDLLSEGAIHQPWMNAYKVFSENMQRL